MSKEAMKLALDLATMHHSDDGYQELRQKVRRVAKAALAEQPAPSQYGSPELQAMIVARAMEKNAAEQPAQRQRSVKPLTDAEIERIYDRYGGNMILNVPTA